MRQKLTGAVLCLLVLWWGAGAWVRAQEILHNGTNVDDDPARVLGFFAGLVSLCMIIAVWMLALSLGTKLLSVFNRLRRSVR